MDVLIKAVCVCPLERNTHSRSLVDTARRAAPSPRRASCCSSTWPWWCSEPWGRNIFQPRTWWSRSSLWYLAKKKKKTEHMFQDVFSMKQILQSRLLVFLQKFNGFSYRNSVVCCRRAQSPAGTCTGNCRVCWCKCQTGKCWVPPCTRWCLGGKTRAKWNNHTNQLSSSWLISIFLLKYKIRTYQRSLFFFNQWLRIDDLWNKV